MSARKKFKRESEAIQYLKDSIDETYNKWYKLLLKINDMTFK